MGDRAVSILSSPVHSHTYTHIIERKTRTRTYPYIERYMLRVVRSSHTRIPGAQRARGDRGLWLASTAPRTRPSRINLCLAYQGRPISHCAGTYISSDALRTRRWRRAWPPSALSRPSILRPSILRPSILRPTVALTDPKRPASYHMSACCEQSFFFCERILHTASKTWHPGIEGRTQRF